jgi:hypothetical protein
MGQRADRQRRAQRQHGGQREWADYSRLRPMAARQRRAQINTGP